MASRAPARRKTPWWRTKAAWKRIGLWTLIGGAAFALLAFIALLIAVFPANVEMALEWQRSGHPHRWAGWARLPLQPFLIWWAWQYAGPGRQAL